MKLKTLVLSLVLLGMGPVNNSLANVANRQMTSFINNPLNYVRDKVYTLGDDIVNYIKKREGFRAKPYEDIGNHASNVGYGSQNTRLNALARERIAQGGKGITEQEASNEMVRHINKEILEPLSKEPYYSHLRDNQIDALVDLIYSTGYGTFKKSKKLQAALNTGNWNEAARHMTHGQNLKNDQVNQRRQENRDMFLGNVDIANIVDPKDSSLLYKANKAMAFNNYKHSQRIPSDSSDIWLHDPSSFTAMNYSKEKMNNQQIDQWALNNIPQSQIQYQIDQPISRQINGSNRFNPLNMTDNLFQSQLISFNSAESNVPRSNPIGWQQYPSYEAAPYPERKNVVSAQSQIRDLLNNRA